MPANSVEGKIVSVRDPSRACTTTVALGLLDRLDDRFFTLPEAFGADADPP